MQPSTIPRSWPVLSLALGVFAVLSIAILCLVSVGAQDRHIDVANQQDHNDTTLRARIESSASAAPDNLSPSYLEAAHPSLVSRLWSRLRSLLGLPVSSSFSFVSLPVCTVLGAADWSPKFDVVRLGADRVLLALELPAVERSSLRIVLRPREIVIGGERYWRSALLDQQTAIAHLDADVVAPKLSYAMHLGTSEGRFERHFALSDRVSLNSVSATYDDGTLFVTLPTTTEREADSTALLVPERLVPIRF